MDEREHDKEVKPNTWEDGVEICEPNIIDGRVCYAMTVVLPVPLPDIVLEYDVSGLQAFVDSAKPSSTQ
jgi:hypothetical protein